MNKVVLATSLAALVVGTAAKADRPPSVYVRCDGLPDNVTAGETAARLLGAVTLLGLFAPPHEPPNAAARQAGAEGIASCNEALVHESNDIRRAQLLLALAVHNIEAGQYDAAIAAARRAETDRPAFAGSAPFRYSLHLSALEIEAMAELAAGHGDAAIAKAYEMANAAPYDLVAQFRAARYVLLGGRFGPQEDRYFANLVRLAPASVLQRATMRQMVGDFRAAAEDYDLWMRLERSMVGKPDMASLAQAALLRALAGDAGRAEELAGQARAALQAEPASAVAQSTTEVLDLYQIWKLQHDGRGADARLLFTNRTSWPHASSLAVAEVARLLREGQAPATLTGPLAQDPAHYRTELLERWRHDFTDQKRLFTTVRFFHGQGEFERFGGNVYRISGSRYFANEDNARLNGRLISVARDGFGTPAGYALLLHAALTARAQGKRSFMILPAQTNVAQAFVRMGNPGDEAMIAPMSFDAAQVIADLGPIIPRPVQH